MVSAFLYQITSQEKTDGRIRKTAEYYKNI